MPQSGSNAAWDTANAGLDSLMSQATQIQAANKKKKDNVESVGNVDYKQLDPAKGSESFKGLLDQINSRIASTQAPSYESFLQQGINSPLIQAVLGPALARLQPGAEDSRTALMDQFRQAGALGSSAMGAAGAKNEANIQQQQGDLISQVIAAMLPQMTQGLNQQFQNQMSIPTLLAQVLGQTRPDTVTGSNVPPTDPNASRGGGSVHIGKSSYGMGGGGNSSSGYQGGLSPARTSPPGVGDPSGGLDYNLQDLFDQITGGGDVLNLGNQGGDSGSGFAGGYDPFDDGYGSGGNDLSFAEEY